MTPPKDKDEGKAAVVMVDNTPSISMSGNKEGNLMRGDVVYINKDLLVTDNHVLTLCHIWKDGHKFEVVIPKKSLKLV